MVDTDVEAVVPLHRICFPDYFVTELGPKFLSILYSESLHEIALVAVDGDGRLLGYHLSFIRPSRTFVRLMARRGPQFLMASLPTAAQGLNKALKVAGALTRPTWRMPKGSAICMYTAVSPDARGRGVARKLLVAMRAAAIDRGIESLFGENEDDSKLCALYESVGFRRHDIITAPDGTRKVRMLMDLRDVVVPSAERALSIDAPSI